VDDKTGKTQLKLTDAGNFGVNAVPPDGAFAYKMTVRGSTDNDSGYALWVSGLTATTPGLVVRNDGNVGIGTASPERLMHVVRSATDSVNGNTLTSYEIAQFKVHSSSGKRGLEIGAPTGDTSGPVYLKVHGTGNNLAFLNQNNVATITVLESGNVGIGIIPSAKLEVAGQIKITGGTPGAGKVLTSDANGLASWQAASGGGGGGGGMTVVQNPTHNGTKICGIPHSRHAAHDPGVANVVCAMKGLGVSINSTTAMEGGSCYTWSGTAWDFDGGHGNKLASVTCASGSSGGSSQWTTAGSNIHFNTGNVGIGTTNPTYKLHVDGTVAAVSMENLSDARYKTDIQPLAARALDIITQLRPVSFRWKQPDSDGMKGERFGFIAQEVEGVLPQIVSTQRGREDTKRMRSNEMLPVLVKAIQELREELCEIKPSAAACSRRR